MNETEETFVRTFITKEKQNRWLSLLPLKKGRSKMLSRFAHIFVDDVRQKFLHNRDSLTREVAHQIEKVLDVWKKANPEQLCHIMAYNHKIDGQRMNFAGAEASYGLTFGGVIIVVPNKLAFYYTERSNINKEPFYVLFNP
ncbi:MAG: hypothetical protein M3Y82_00525 [Verrucomicrobiota bacterium]|nr:hypothetical protein [Verrucomicrobiota bacterium]